MNMLGLDLGTTTGWALNYGQEIYCGSWKLASSSEITVQRRIRADRDCDVRIPRLFEKISYLIRQYGIEQLIFEDVQFISTTCQGQLWASLRSCVWLQTTEHGLRTVQIHAVPVKVLKKFATGWGNASKDQMIRTAEDFLPTVNLEGKFDDNVADALHLLKYGLNKFNV